VVGPHMASNIGTLIARLRALKLVHDYHRKGRERDSRMRADTFLGFGASAFRARQSADGVSWIIITPFLHYLS